MKTTIKQKVLELLMEIGPLRRKELTIVIKKAQGKKGAEAFDPHPGYYGTNLQQWVAEGLISNSKKGYSITKKGIKYIEDPSFIKQIRLEMKIKRLEHTLRWKDQQIDELRSASPLDDMDERSRKFRRKSKHEIDHFKKLHDRIIKDVRYMTEGEAKAWGWYKRPLMIILDNGDIMIPQSDDEGNDGGAIYMTNPSLEGRDHLIYVIE